VLALAHTALFGFPAKSVELGARDLLAHMHSSNGIEQVRPACAAVCVVARVAVLVAVC